LRLWSRRRRSVRAIAIAANPSTHLDEGL